MTAVRTSAEPRRRPERLVMVGCILASSTVGLDGIMTTIALPTITSDLDAGLSTQQWIVAAFLLSLGGLLLAGGSLGDIYGPSRILVLGVTGFLAATLVVALAPTPGVLVAGRLMQGVAVALILPTMMAVLTTTYSGERKTWAISLWAAWSGVPVFAGPPVGGILVDAVGWRALYLAELPLIALTLLLLLRVLNLSTDRGRGGTVDVAGAALSVLTIGSSAFVLIQGPQLGWSHPAVMAATTVGCLTAAALVGWERRATNPLLPLGLLRNRRFAVLNVVTFLLYGGLIASGTYTVIFLQNALGLHPAVAGVIGAVPVMVLSLLSGRLSVYADRWGGDLFVAAGSTLAGIGILLLLGIGLDPDAAVTLVLISVLIHGLGLAMLVAPLTSGVMSAVPDGRAGVASALNNAVARIGSMVAIAVAGVVMTIQFSVTLDSGLARRPMGPGSHAAIAEAATRPLSTERTAGLADEEAARLDQARAKASVAAFQAGMALSGGLTVAAGILALIGTRRRPGTPRYRSADTVGCPITGMRSHPDAPATGGTPPGAWHMTMRSRSLRDGPAHHARSAWSPQPGRSPIRMTMRWPRR
ncbi:MFS transporter [Spirillospora sp. NPDC047279]|uniref:MFS transporter n=1 Tax=Spirillospora sp. NPDC047279 TaxID=3155478 RepID=UPI003401DCC8